MTPALMMIVVSNPPAGAYIPVLLIPLGVIVFMILYLNSTRGTPLPDAVPLAEEVHGSSFWGAVLIIGGVGIVVGTMQSPIAIFLLGALAICAVIVVSGLAAWTGFRYSFTPYGFEIGTLGYRLRSIPKDQIKSFAIEPWNLLRGYGIRGVGNLRAYVWGNRGVMIDTAQGKVYLGHNNPDQIVRDLEMIAINHQGHEVARGKA